MRDSPDTLIDQLVADLRPVAPLRQRRGMALAVACLALGAALVAALVGLRADILAGRPAPLPLTAGGLFLVLALASAWAAVDVARPAVGIRREGWGWTALMAAVLPVSALALLAADLARGQAPALDAGGTFCLGLGLEVGLITAAALVLWLRRGAPSRPDRAGLLAGVAAGAAGIFAVSLRCPHDGLLHIGLWHGGAVILAGVIGRFGLSRLLVW